LKFEDGTSDRVDLTRKNAAEKVSSAIVRRFEWKFDTKMQGSSVTSFCS